jgi:hypothetical protein
MGLAKHFDDKYELSKGFIKTLNEATFIFNNTVKTAKITYNNITSHISLFFISVHEEIREIKKPITIIFIIIILSLILCFTWETGVTSIFGDNFSLTSVDKDSKNLIGTLGDFFGGLLNPIIGAIGFIALTITISMQTKQNKESTLQNFENSIFNLLNLQNGIIENLEYKENTRRLSFSKFLEENQSQINPIAQHKFIAKIKKSKAREFYKNFNAEHNGYFGHYFRNLYRILKMIDTSPYDSHVKRNYARIIRAQLSMEELTVLFLNCLPDVCDDGAFSNLLFEYQMLEHLSVKKIEITSCDDKLSIEHEYIIGGKARVCREEIVNYICKNEKTYLYEISSGAFGQNTSTDLNNLKHSISKH